MFEPLTGSVAWHETIASVLLHFLWQGCAVALLVELAVRVVRLRSGAPRYAAYLAGLAVMAACPAITLAFLSASVREVSTASAVVPSISAQPLNWSAELAAIIRPHSMWITAAWFAGVGCLSFRYVCGIWGLQRVRARVQAVPTELIDQARSIAKRLGVRLTWTLRASESAREPMTFGWLRPVILLPVALLTAQPPALLEAVLAHELAHIRRYDLWVNALQRFVESLLFFHPVVWWMSRRVREEREICCDDIAVGLTGEPLVYATALERVASHRIEQQVAPLAVAMSGGVLRYRVRRALGLADPVASTAAPSPRVLLMAALFCGTLALTSSGGTQWVGHQLSGESPADHPLPAPIAADSGSEPFAELPVNASPTIDSRAGATASPLDAAPQSQVNIDARIVDTHRDTKSADAASDESTDQKSALTSFDTNGDGTLDAAERKAIETAYATKMKDRSRQMLEKYDSNGDGKLDFREKALAWSKFHRSRHGRHRGHHQTDRDRRPGDHGHHSDRSSRGHGPSNWMKQLVAKYDADGNGSLDESERKTMHAAWKQRRSTQWRSFMERYDIDGNGHIDQHERMAIHLARVKASKIDRKYPGST